VIAGLLVALVALVSYGAMEGMPDEIRAKRLFIQDVLFVGDRSHEYLLVGAEQDKGFTLVAGSGGRAIVAIARKKSEPDSYSANLYEMPLNYWQQGGIRVQIAGRESGGTILISNKTGEEVVQLYADEYGMGYVGAFDRQGKGRTLQPR
jgi:hypothetical protein